MILRSMNNFAGGINEVNLVVNVGNLPAYETNNVRYSAAVFMSDGIPWGTACTISTGSSPNGVTTVLAPVGDARIGGASKPKTTKAVRSKPKATMVWVGRGGYTAEMW